jgi:hypothetical protein
MSSILDINDWQKHIDYKKKNIIEQIDNSIILDNSIENKKFTEILKTIINLKIFNVSQFTFLAIKLLVKSLFIDSEIILDIINNDSLSQNNSNTNPDTNLKNILILIIDFVVQIEISLNYNCILITHFLNKIDKIDNKNVVLNDQPNFFSSFSKFSKIDNDISNCISKQSTVILLFLKFISKIGVYKNDKTLINTIINFNDDDKDDKDDKDNSITKTQNNRNYRNKSKILSSKLKMYLDTFMININNYFLNNMDNMDNMDNSRNTTIYSICIEYIISIVEILYNEFNYLFDILETCIISNLKYKNINFTEDRKKELDNIKNEIKKSINNEINRCKELFKM